MDENPFKLLKLPGDASVAADQAGPVQLAGPGISSLPFKTPKLPSFHHLFGSPILMISFPAARGLKLRVKVIHRNSYCFGI